jgi:hypothetical protein
VGLGTPLRQREPEDELFLISVPSLDYRSRAPLRECASNRVLSEREVIVVYDAFSNEIKRPVCPLRKSNHESTVGSVPISNGWRKSATNALRTQGLRRAIPEGSTFE